MCRNVGRSFTITFILNVSSSNRDGEILASNAHLCVCARTCVRMRIQLFESMSWKIILLCPNLKDLCILLRFIWQKLIEDTGVHQINCFFPVLEVFIFCENYQPRICGDNCELLNFFSLILKWEL